MEDLSATEHDGDLDLVALVEEFGHLSGLGVEVAGTDLRPVLHLLDPYVDRLASRFLGSLRRIELELAIVHDSGDGWIRQWGNLDQVEIELTGDVQRLGEQLDTELLSIGVDQAHFASADTIVDPGLIGGDGGCYSTSLPVWGHGLPVTNKKGSGTTAGPSPTNCRQPDPLTLLTQISAVAGWESSTARLRFLVCQ